MDGKRLGRGEALRRLLEAQSGSIPERPTPSAAHRREPEYGESFQTGATGRSSVFADYKQDEIRSPKLEQTAPSLPRGGRGRALLAALAAATPSTPTPMERQVETMTRRLGDMPLAEAPEETKEPVIMKGTYGREISLAVNYVKLKVQEGKGVFQYNVSFDPPVDSKGARFGLLKECSDVIGETRLFDGAILYLPFKLPQKVTVLKSTLKSDNSPVTVVITFTKQRKFGDPETIHLYNILFRKIMVVLGMALHGNNFYDPKVAMPIPMHKLEVWPGFITAIDEFEGGLMLCCDASHRVLRNQTVLELMREVEIASRRNWEKDFLDLILGQSVLTRYNNRVYRIDDVAFDESPNDCFEKNNGEKISYCEYYFQQYNIRIKEVNQPLLKSKVKCRIRGREQKYLVSLVPELCFLTGITDAMRSDARVMKDLTQCICVSPHQRNRAITDFIKNIQRSREANKILSDWGLSIDDAFMHLPGRVLPPLDVTFGGGYTARGTAEANWSSACNKNKALSTIDINNWAVVCLKREDMAVNTFLEQVSRFAPQIGMRIAKPRIFFMNDDRTDSYIRTLRPLTSDKALQTVMVVLPLARNDKYSAIKKLCCIENPIPSQVMLSKTVRKAATARTIALKVALQMNCKLGGTLWSVQIPVQLTMVCGLDTYHDPRRKTNSVGALVSSMNQPLTRWYSKVYSQPPGLELVDGLEITMMASLQKFNEISGKFPEQILIYRDGVSDGQLQTCKEYELPQIIKACRRISPGYEPYILFVIVQKRINTRIFLSENREIGNPPPGTILDHTVTRRYLYDFFLVSQHVNQGTVSPTHYIVLHNTTKLNPDQVQRFSYALTHLYYNWPGTIRVPAPCQYAHKLAYLVGESIHKEANEILADKLFYL